MARQEYNPRLPEIRQQVSLEPTVRSYQLNSYDEKRRDYVQMPDPNTGLQWGQLARALGKWEPALDRLTEEAIKDDANTTFAKYRDLQAQQEKLDMTLVEFTKAFPEHLGASPVARKGWDSMRYERLSMQIDTEMRQAYVDNGWGNLEKPEEYKAAVSSWVANRRKELLGDVDEEMLPLVDKYFTPGQLRAENNLDSYHMSERTKANTAKGKQETGEFVFAGVDGIVRSPHRDFFAPDQLESSIATLGAFLTTARDRSMSFGVPAHMANEWVKESLFQYAESMDLGVNDHRAEILFTALDHIPTGTGVLGRTASSQLALAEFIERSETRRYRAEEREYQRQAREREENKRKETDAIVWGVNDDPNASLEEIAEKRGIPLTWETVTRYNQYKKALSEASKVQETPENTLATAEMVVDIREGRKTIEDGLELLRRGQITESQWTTIRGDAPNEPARAAKMKRLTQNAGMQDAVAFLRKTWGEAANASATPEGRVQAHLQAETAVTLFKNAVYREIDIVESNGEAVDYNRALAIVEKHKAALGDLNNSVVKDAATARFSNQYSFAPMAAVDDKYQRTSELGSSEKPIYTPSPTSPVAMASPRSLRLLEQGARKAEVDPLVVFAFAKHESSFKEAARPLDPQTGKPLSSAYGYMQLIDGTAKDLGVDKYDPAQNAYGGAKYIKQIAAQHGLDLTKPEDVAKAYCFYHDGPNTKGPFSATAQNAAAKVAETFKTLQEDAGAQKAQAAAKEAEEKTAEKARIQVTFPNVETAAEAVKAINAGWNHPALEKFATGIIAAGGAKPSKAQLETAAAEALKTLMADLSAEDKEQLKLFLQGHLLRFRPKQPADGEAPAK